jgi:hypothetical protein
VRDAWELAKIHKAWEEQGRPPCLHKNVSDEIMCGQRTGDQQCWDCGTVTSREQLWQDRSAVVAARSRERGAPPCRHTRVSRAGG